MRPATRKIMQAIQPAVLPQDRKSERKEYKQKRVDQRTAGHGSKLHPGLGITHWRVPGGVTQYPTWEGQFRRRCRRGHSHRRHRRRRRRPTTAVAAAVAAMRRCRNRPPPRDRQFMAGHAGAATPPPREYPTAGRQGGRPPCETPLHQRPHRSGHRHRCHRHRSYTLRRGH